MRDVGCGVRGAGAVWGAGWRWSVGVCGEMERGMHAGRVIVFVRDALNHKYPNETLRVYVRPGRPWAHIVLPSRPGLACSLPYSMGVQSALCGVMFQAGGRSEVRPVLEVIWAGEREADSSRIIIRRDDGRTLPVLSSRRGGLQHTTSELCEKWELSKMTYRSTL